jgi:hypothetical protein
MKFRKSRPHSPCEAAPLSLAILMKVSTLEAADYSPGFFVTLL